MDTPEVKPRARKKKEDAPAAAEVATVPQAAEPAVVPPPPPAAAGVSPKALTGPNLNKPLKAVQFHTGVILGPSLSLTGINVAHLKKTQGVDVELRLLGPGVWIKVKGMTFVVPFSNVLKVELGEADAE